MMQTGPRHPHSDDEKREESHRKRDFTVWFVVVALIVVWLLSSLFGNMSSRREVPYSLFEAWVEADRVASVIVGPDRIEGELKNPSGDEPARFSTFRVDPSLAARLQTHGAQVTGTSSENWLGAIITWLAPFIILYLLWSFMFRRMGGASLDGYLGYGKSRAKLYAETAVRVTFNDVAGVDEAKAELQEVVAFLRDPKSFGRLGARAPKGTLLVGPPGTGKTLLARAVAGEAGVPFFSISGSEFVELFVGIGAARVRDLFDQARKAAPAIIFIDELDALGRSRSSFAFAGHDEKEQTLNQLLAEIDGFDPAVGVILLAATNRPEILDKALLRAGRFDRQILVDRPDRKGRLAILLVHVKKIRLSQEVDLEVVAGLTTGFAGADIANLVNEAAIAATRRGGDSVRLSDFEVAIERIVAGIEKRSRILRPAERRRVAYHEIGHALVAASLKTTDPVRKVSIVPRGLGALGYTMQRPTEDRFLLSRTELEERLAVLLGGRAAEALVFLGDISTGATDDLEHATAIALDMVTRFGMAAELGERTFSTRMDMSLQDAGVARTETSASDATQREVDLAIRELIASASDRAQAILVQRREDMDHGAEMLLAKETLTTDDFPALAKCQVPETQAA
jgi:cell division protease FtsH